MAFPTLLGLESRSSSRPSAITSIIQHSIRLLTMGPYYDTIRNPSSFARHASDAENFETLLMNTADTGASNWGTNHLFALRVLCSEPTSQLKLLQPYYPASSSGFEPCIISLIDGYQGVNLAQLQEPQIIRRFQPNRLGYV
jgi:hypothetical protein